MRKRNTVLLSALVMSMSASIIQPSESQSRKLGPTEQKLISDRIGVRLNDPRSAQYRWPGVRFETRTQEGLLPYCFFVNAKNLYGGYVGFRTVFGMLKGAHGKLVDFEFLTGLSATASVDADKLCKIFGVQP
jgi:hypothetical protein